MESCVDLHTQLASIMEVLANAAVAEICQLVDDGFASLRLEISRSQRENLALKSRLRLMEVRAGERARRGTVPSLVVTCPRRELHFEEDAAVGTNRKAKSTTLENHDSQQPQTVEVEVMQQPVDPEVSEIKREELEEQDPQPAASSNIRPQSPPHPPAAQSIDLLGVGAEISRDSASCCFGRLEPPKQEMKEGAREIRASSQHPPAEQSHRAAPRGPSRDSTGEDERVVDLRDSVPAESSRSTVTVTVEEAPLIKALDTGMKGLCSAAADWRGEAVKLETESSWSEAFRTCNAVNRTECVSDSRGINSNNTKNEAAELDTNSLDSSYFDDLFSSPEVAQSLIAPQKLSTDAAGATGMDESLSSSSSSFPFLSSRSSSGNSSTSGCFSGSSISSATSDSRCRNFTGSTEQVFSCQQCGCLFHASRDLVVHQRSHTGERIYHCQLCKKAFVHPHQLKTHQRVHTGEKPFSCAQCGKRFSQSSHIKRHMSVHTGEKRYSCSLCGKRFSQACSLKVHQAVHTGERPYSCTKCGKSFSVLGNLVRHQSVHMGK